MKSSMKKRICSTIMATILATSSLIAMSTRQVTAASGEGLQIAKYTYDANYDNNNAYSGNDLGLTYTKERSIFKVWSPRASKVVLARYQTGSDNEAGAASLGEIEMTLGARGVWSATVPDDIVNTYYTYKVTVDGNTQEACDIYAKAVGVNGHRAMVVDLESTNPDNWDTNYTREKSRLSDMITWEVHIRDFSNQASSGVSEGNRGKYLAFTEKGTTVNGEGITPTGVDYLKELGVTHVQLLPMYDYAYQSVDETNPDASYNWGYDPQNYNAPEGSYASNPYDGNVRINEMKQMIQALHDAGIKVVMDVVYNHTFKVTDSNFTKIMPDYYYRHWGKGQYYSDGSGCENETRSESAMYRKFMRESILYWAEEYNIDGFRFDLMAVHDVDTMNYIREDLDHKFGEGTIILYGEGWNGGDSLLDYNQRAGKHNVRKLNNIGMFNEQIRDAVKGEHNFDKTEGLVQYGYNFSGGKTYDSAKFPDSIFKGMIGSVGQYTTNGKPVNSWEWQPVWADQSDKVVSYTSAHDNVTTWDKLVSSLNGLTIPEKADKDFWMADPSYFTSKDSKLLSMNKMAGSIILTSHGGSFMQAGEEFARTKNGHNNSYKFNGSINSIDWKRVEDYSEIQKYYQGMIAIRKAFSGFRTNYEESGNNDLPKNFNLTWISPNDYRMQMGFYLTNNVVGEWNRLAVLINNATTAATVNLTGSDQWVIIADGTTAGTTKIRESGSSVSLAAKSVVIAVPKATFDNTVLNVKNNPSRLIGVSDKTVQAYEKVEFTIAAHDIDGDAVTLSANDLPTGASFHAATGKFTWENAVEGNYTITFSATDGKAITQNSMTLTVVPNTNINKYTITFQTQGGSTISSIINVLSGAKIQKPTSNPTRTGYTFGGWYKEASCTNVWNFDSDTVTGSMILYAKWSPTTYKITYNLNKGKQITGQVTTYTFSRGYNLKNPTRAKYKFSGWYTTPNFKGAKVKAISKNESGNKTYYAKWEQVKVNNGKIKNLSSKGRKLNITMNKVNGVDGYSIQYSTTNGFKKGKAKTDTLTYKGNKTQKSIAKLGGKKLKVSTAYFVRVRAYKLDSAGKKVWGKYSDSKKVVLK